MDIVDANVDVLAEQMKNLQGHVEVMEEERSQASTSSTSPGSEKGITLSPSSLKESVFRDALKNYWPFGNRMTLNDLSGEDAFERGGELCADTRHQVMPQVGQGMAEGMVPPQNHFMHRYETPGGVKDLA